MVGPPPTAGQASTQLSIDDLQSATFKLIDFGSGMSSCFSSMCISQVACWLANTLTRQWAAMLQPRALRSPEVILGADWDTKVDVWNLTCLVRVYLLRGISIDLPPLDI